MSCGIRRIVNDCATQQVVARRDVRAKTGVRAPGVSGLYFILQDEIRPCGPFGGDMNKYELAGFLMGILLFVIFGVLANPIWKAIKTAIFR